MYIAYDKIMLTYHNWISWLQSQAFNIIICPKNIRLDFDVLDDKRYQEDAEKTMQEFTSLVRNTAVSSLSFQIKFCIFFNLLSEQVTE